MGSLLVIAGGDPPDRNILESCGQAEFVIAADSGLRVARTHGLSIDLLVGDLDSVSEGDLAWAEAEGVEVIEVPTDKDFTDLELALDRAAQTSFDHVVVIGVGGGRIDHELGNWSVLCAPRSQTLEIRSAGGTVTVLHGAFTNTVELSGEPGDVVSIVARNGEATGVTTVGLRWPLGDATLASHSSRGISNEFIGATATISVENGTLLIARPANP